MGYHDELQMAALAPTVGEIWTHHNKTRDPDKGRPDHELLVFIEFGRVRRVVCTPLREIPRQGNGLEGLPP
jgi:hypothetical protein